MAVCVFSCVFDNFRSMDFGFVLVPHFLSFWQVWTDEGRSEREKYEQSLNIEITTNNDHSNDRRDELMRQGHS